SPKTDLNDTVTIPGNSTVTYKIVAKVNPRVVSPQITNVATVLEGANPIGTSSVQHNIIPPGGGITRVVDKAVYKPGDTIKYTITVDSTGPGYQNNIPISELVKDLQIELIDGTFGNPFNGLFSVKKIVTNETDGTETVFTVGPIKDENLVGTVDVKPGEKVQYVIEGIVRPDAYGPIDNNGLVTVPFRWNLENTKKVKDSKYEPGGFITYIITIRNNSNGNAQNIPVTDDFTGISVLDSTGAIITPALSDFSIVSSVIAPISGTKSHIGNPVITNGVFTATPDIQINGSITYMIKAKVADKAVGLITNTAFIDGDAVSNQVGPSIDKPFVEKTVVKFYEKNGDKALTSSSYTPGGFVEYRVVLKNDGKGILNNGTFSDEIGSVMTKYASGVEGPAFDSWTVTRESATGASTIPDINNTLPLGTVIQNSPAKPAITATMDLHPAGQIVYIIKAKINENAIGTFTNTASLNGLTSKITSSSQPANIVHTKEVYDETGTTKITTFKPGDTIVYKMVVENTGLGISASKNYKDIINNIVGEIAETPGSVAIPTAPVFANTPDINVDVKRFARDPANSNPNTNLIPAGNVTTVGTMNNTINLVGSVTIAPKELIVFTVKGKLRDDLIGKFVNTSNYDGNIQTKELKPESTTIETKKTLTILNGKPFGENNKIYKPGDSVEYVIEIKNTGKSFFNNLIVRDNTDAIVTSLTGNTTGKALESVEISIPVVSNSLSKPVLTDIKPITGNTTTNLQAEIDFAPGDVITYTIKGKIVKSAIGVIPANVVTVNGKPFSTDVINPILPKIISEKKLISPEDKLYGPNEVIKYELIIENTGDGFGDNIKIIDKISDIKTTLLNGTLGQAFSSWTVKTAITYASAAISGNGIDFTGQTILKNTLIDNVNIDTEVDIAPKSKVVITIEATTSTLAAGTIINTATINGENKPSDPINPRSAIVEFYKLPLVDGVTTYAPGGDTGFRLALLNKSTNAIAKDIDLVDIISGIKVESASGGLVDAFQAGWTLETVILSGDATKYSSTGIGSGGDITAGKVTLAPGQTFIVRIKGKANATAVGNIVNKATAKYNGTDLGEKTVTLTPTPGVAELVKTVNKAEYTPGGKLIYTLTLKNTGTGYLNDVSLIDNFKNVNTELATGVSGPAFEAVTQSNALPVTFVKDTSYADGYKATGDLAPGGTLIVILEATIAPSAAGKITNIANILNSVGTPITEDKSDNTTTVNPLPANLKILKTVDKTTYTSGEVLTYKITLGNVGSGWANGIKVTDAISTIKAKINGVDESAFESWSISWVKSAGSAEVLVSGQTFPVTNTTTEDLNARVSLAPL
ncbi:hypothetical protein, partial [Cetobacterium sp.]|uniref:hypothetical protein n=1 Tax=Cetobacterium sp. TaxID=2071632 RepID=UPI003F2D27F8